jgi:hypothetical protein
MFCQVMCSEDSRVTFRVQETLSAFRRYERQTASVAAMCVSNPDRSPIAIHR